MNGKPVFEYHRNSIEYVDKTLEEQKNSDPIGQNNHDLKLFNNCPNIGNRGAGSLVRIGRKPPKLAVVGSNPTPPATGSSDVFFRFEI